MEFNKTKVAAKNVNQYEKEIEDLTRDAINSITASDWKKEIEHIENWKVNTGSKIDWIGQRE